MDHRNVEMFAQSYPKSSVTQTTVKSMPSMRTPIQSITPAMGWGSSEGFTPKKIGMSQDAKEGSKKFLVVLFITILGAFIYSAFAYTITDSLFGKMNLEFFSDTGIPGHAIIAIHSIIFFILIYLIINTIKWY